MSGVVVDCSIAATWYLSDEASDETDALLAHVLHGPALVPELWHVEFANVLLCAERRGRITAAQVAEALNHVSLLPLETDHFMVSQAWRETLSLARTEKLTIYDAVYLELALRKSAALATRDDDLRAAAERAGVKVLP